MIRLYFHIFHRNISDAAIYQEFNFLVHSHGDKIYFDARHGAMWNFVAKFRHFQISAEEKLLKKVII